MESVDLIIRHGTVISMDEQCSVHSDGAIAIRGNRIVKVGTTSEIESAFSAANYLEASHKAVLPGIVNVHTHVCGSLFKGLTEDRADGFYGLALPAEKHLTPDLTYDLSLLGCVETVKAGSTCINDIYHFMSKTAEAVEAVGLRANLAHKILETDLSLIQYNDYTRIPEEGRKRLAENVDLVEKWHGKANGRILCRFGPHAADTLSLEFHREVAATARQYGVGLHIHVAQKTKEVEFIRSKYGFGAVELLQEAGIVGPDVVAAHLVYITQDEIEILKSTGTNMAHCAEMMAKRGCFPNMKEMYASGVRVALGTDWVSMDPWDNMRFTIAVARLFGCSEDTINAPKALKMATIEAARALGLSEDIGSIEEGKKADIITIDLNQPHLRPLNEIIPTIVYNASGRDVRDVIIDGKHIVQDGIVTTLDELRVVEEGQKAADYIMQKVGF